MEGEKYNLVKAQEEADKLRKKVESGEVSSYADAEKLIEKEVGDPREKILSAINQIAYKPEVVLQNDEVLDDPQKFNRYLLETLFGKTQLFKTRESFEYIRDHLDEFRGIGVWPEGETPYQVKWLVDSTVESKKSVAEVVYVLQDTFSLTDDQKKKIVIDLYADYCAHTYVKANSILNSLKQELPLDEEYRVLAAKQYLTSRLARLASNYLRDKKDSSNWSSNEHLYKVWDLQNEVQQSKRNLSIEADLFNEPEVVAEGQKLLRAILNSEIDVSLQMSNIPTLHKIAPSFFEGDFVAEGHKLWSRVVEFGSYSYAGDSYNNYDKKTLEILQTIGYDTEKIRALFKETLIAHLTSSHIPVGLIEKYIKGSEHADLLHDDEVVQAGNTGRKVALENLSSTTFSKISEMFNFPTDWATNPEDVALVKKGILKRVEKLYSIQEISRIQNEFGDEIIVNDPEIRLAIQKAIFEDPKPWSRIGEHWAETRDIFNTWNFPIDKLQEYAKGFVVDKLSTPSSYEIHKFTWTEKCLSAFPEILDLPEINDLASSKILEWKYQKKSYGYRELNDAIEDIDKAIKLYKLSPELLDQWKTKVVSIELADIKDKEQLKKFKELLKHLKVSPEGLTGSVNDFYLKALSAGDLKQTSFLAESFSVDPKNISEAELSKAGEVGITEALQQGNFQSILKIQEICHLSPEFFAQPKVNHKVSQLLADQFLCRGEFKDLVEKTDLFGLSSEAYPIMDTQASNSEQLSGNLTKFIKYLGNEDIVAIFPQTFERVREMIFAKLTEDQDLADYFVENLGEYYQQPWVAENVAKAIQQYSVAQKFVYAVENDQTVWKDESWVADIFSKAQTIVEEHKKQWQQDDDQQQDEYGYSHGNEGFSESDPFENHPWRFGGRQIRIASAISELMAGKVNSKELEKLGINNNEISSSLAEVNEKVNTAYQNFLEQIRSNTSIKDDDKQALLNPESSSVRMTALLDNIRSFVARYFVQSVEGDVTRLSEIGNLSNDLDRILAEGFRRYIKIHEVDVPLYDKLYEEFDTLRETGRSPLEVYLGRDGIYAYIGRHSQDVARRRKLGLGGRKKLKEMGEVVEIHPQYTVYPRYFRDNLNQETKRQFLEQEGISPDADPLFYDTGYTGTIPEQIMKVMDFSQEDIERRIRLLSAPSVHRRVKGIPENARSEIIEYIEHNAKTENTAEGLIIDEKTGKIRHIAKPTNPEEQFYCMMVKQAVARHYWLQEQLHHEPSGNVNLDSEHYTIRVRQEYAKLLPSEFMQNPKEFLTQHGEMLKGSKGEGEYPDEEVVLFKMTDGTEIVAKKIELRKAKEARKEFSILISAKKAGLPTAEPVGFLSGKEDTDGSYLLMKKIEGISGRNFDKYLKDTGKFTEEKIKSILQQVAQKNKEMAELFRTTLKIDKRWRIKDTIIELNEETGEVESVIPIDWERAQNFNPATPKEIDEIT